MIDDDFVPKEYKPAPQVVAAHNIPHLTESLSRVDNTFSFYDEEGNINATYFMSAAGLPAIIVALGVLSLIIYQLVLCARCCCECCCKCCKIPTVAGPPDEKGIYWVKTFKHYPALMSFFHIALLGTFIVDFCVYFGNGFLDKAFHEGGDALEALAGVFTDVVTVSNGLVDAADGLSAALRSSACSDVYSYSGSSLTDTLDTFKSNVADVPDIIGSFPSKILDAKDTFLSYGPRKDEVLFLYFAFILFFLLCFLVVPCCGSKWALNTLIFFTELVIITLVIISGVEMVLVMILGDFCMSPADSALSIFKHGSNTNLFNYYLKCEGDSKFVEPLTIASTSVNDFNQSIYDAVRDIQTNYGDSTLGVACLRELAPEIVGVLVSLQDVIHMVMCKPVNQVWDKAVNRSFCTFAVPGLFSIWLCHLFTGFMLFILLIVVSWFHDAFSPVKIEADSNANVTPAPVVLLQTQQGYEMVPAVPVEQVAPAAVQYPNDNPKPSDESHQMEDSSAHAGSHHSHHSHHGHQKHHHHEHGNQHQSNEAEIVRAEDGDYAL